MGGEVLGFMARSTIRTPEPASAPPPPPPPAEPKTASARASAARVAAQRAAQNGNHQEPASNIPRDTRTDAEAASTVRAWPNPPAGDEDFFDWLSQFSSDDWNNIILYVWRTAPTIDRRANGRVTNIGKYGHFVDMERIKLDHGSGGYRIDMCVRNPTGGRTTRLAQHYFQILDLDYPPRVPPGEWIEAPENEAWKWSKAAIETQALTNGNPGTDPNKVFDTVLTGIERLSKGGGGDNAAVMAAVLNSMTQMQQFMLAQADPAKQLAAIQTLVSAMVPKNTGAPDQFVTFLQGELSNMRQEITAMRQAATKGAGSIVDQLQELFGVAKLFGFKIPGAAGATKEGETNWADVTDRVVDKLGDHVPLLIEAIRERNNPQAGGVSGFRIPGPTARPAATVADQPAAAEATPTAETAAPAADGTPAAEGAQPVAQPTITPEQQQRYQAILDTHGQLIKAVAPFMIDKFKQETGYDFRDWFIKRHGEVRWGALREQAGAQTLTDLAQMNDFLRIALAPPEKLLQFFNEFFTPVGEEPPGVTVEDPE